MNAHRDIPGSAQIGAHWRALVIGAVALMATLTLTGHGGHTLGLVLAASPIVLILGLCMLLHLSMHGGGHGSRRR